MLVVSLNPGGCISMFINLINFYTILPNRQQE